MRSLSTLQTSECLDALFSGKGKKERKGKRNRMPKAARIPVEFRRYDKSEPIAGIESIMRGFHIWADRYVSECSGQPHTQQNRNMSHK